MAHRILRLAGPCWGAALFLLAASEGRALPVHIAIEGRGSGGMGAGWSVGKGRECYVVVPSHVVSDASANAIKVTDGSGRVGRANVVKDLGEEFDVALLKLTESGAIACPEEWNDGAGALSEIRDADFLVAERTDANGRLEKRRFFVSSVSNEFIELDPYDKGDRVQEGCSGSALFAGKTLVGMVTHVDTGTGRVTAVTQSQIHGLVGRDVVPDAGRVVLLQPFLYRRQESPYATIAARDYISKETPWRIVEAQPPAPSRRPSVDAAPPTPAGVDYVLSGQLLDVGSRSVANPNYKRASQREPQHFGDRLLGSLASSLGRDQNTRYFRVYNIDVEIVLTDVAESRTLKNLERRELRYPSDNANAGELEKSAVAEAVSDSLQLTLEKHGLLLRKGSSLPFLRP